MFFPKITLFLFITAASLILLGSCTVKKETRIDLETVDKESVIKKVKLFQSSIKSLKSLAKVRIKTPDHKISYSQVTIAQVPDLFRLEALNPFGKTVGFISSDGSNIYVISKSGQRVYDASQGFHLSYLDPKFNLEITPQELVKLVLGRLPYNVFNKDGKLEISVDGEFLKLVVRDNEQLRDNTLWVDRYSNRIEKAVIFPDGRSKVEIKYRYFKGLKDGYYFPRVIYFKTEELSIAITYDEDVKLNAVVDNSLFRLPHILNNKTQMGCRNCNSLVSRN